MIKLTRQAITTYLIIFFAFSSVAGLFLFNPFGADEAEAAWFNDNWSYRQAITATVATNASDRTNVDLYLTIDTTGITSKLQSACQDLRFTDVSGNVLPYYIQSCNDNSATNKLFVRATLIPKNSTSFTMYMYYDNPSATAGSDANAFNLYAGINGYWSFEETSAWATNCSTESVLDSSGNGTTFAPCPNASPATQDATGKFGSSVLLDGSADRLDSLADDAIMDVSATESLTLSAWVNFSSTANNGGIIQKKGGSASAANAGWMFTHFSTGNGGNFCIYVSDGTTQEEACTASYTTLSTWVHVVAVYDRSSSNNSGVWINGVRDVSVSNTFTSPPVVGDLSNTSSESIGSHGTVGSQYLAGEIDDVRMYKRALSQSEISQLYSNTTGNIAVTNSFATEEKGPAPTMYWEFDQGQGTTAEDATSNALDGTLNNTPTWQTENMCIAGLCLYFDGSGNENVSIADDAKLDFAASDNFTLGAWVKRNSASSANTVIMQKSGANIGSTYTGYKMYMDASGDLCFDIQDGTNAVDSACTSAVDFDDDAWHFIEGVKAATTSITLYVDGKQRAQDASISSTGTLANASTFRVGIDSDGLANDWLGFIDEVKVYRDQTARTAAQVLSDYNARSNPEGISQQQSNNTQNIPAALSNGLISYWKMDESAADTCTGGVNDSCDSSGNGKNAPWTGNISATTGKFNNAISLDGTGDYISMGADATYNLGAGNYSLCSWFKTSSSDKDIIGNGASSTGHYLLQVDGGGNLKAHAWTSSSNNAITSTTTVTGGTWTHGCQVIDSTNISVYVNGVRENTAVMAGTRGGQTGTFTIGARAGGGSNEWNGQLDEVRVYNRALSSSEVSGLYNWAPGPVGYWKLDEKTGQSVTDSSGNGYNGDFGATSGSESTDPEWTQGKFGGGIQITASDTDRTTIAHNDALNPSAITIVSWVKRVNLASSGNIVSKRSNEGYRFRSDGSGLIEWFDRGGVNNISSGSNTIPSNQWAHVAVTGSASGLKIYINGILANSNAVAYGAGATTGSLFFGGDPGGVGEHFNGGIDDVKIYNYERTAGQIVEDMNAGHPAPGSPVGTPVGFWKFNEGADNTCSGGTNDVCNSGSGSTTFDGTSTATRTNSGKLSRALDFDGSDDVVTITNASGIDLNENLANFTFSSWIYADTDGEADTGQIFNKGASTYFRVDTQGTTDLDLECNLDLATTDANVNVTDGLTTAAWNHVACTWNGTTMSIYINGLLRGSSSSGSGAISADANNLLIGGPTTANFDGKIDEFKVYNSALTTSQIALDANSASAQVLGATGNNSTAGALSAESQEYCIPGDSSTCTSPVLKWELETGTGTTIFDTSGSGKTGTLNGTSNVTWTPNGKIGKGINFNGATSTSQNLSTDTTYTPPTTVTVEAWVYSKGAGANTVGQIFKTFNGTGTGYFLTQQSTNCYRWRSVHATAGQWFTPASTLTLNTWQHIAVTYDAGSLANVPSIYINGKLQTLDGTCSATVTPVGAWTSSAGNWTVGGDSSSVNTYNGIIDHVMIFDYQRTAAQIAYDYNRGAPLAHWKMDECQGTTINDSSGGGATGTLTNFATPGTCATSGSWFDGVVGKRNYSLSFDGSDDYASMGTGLYLSSEMTISTWVKIDTLNGNFRDILTKMDSSGCESAYEFGIGTNNLFYFAWTDGGCGYESYDLVGFTPVINTWYNVAVTRNAALDTVYFYINGIRYTGTLTSSDKSMTGTTNSPVSIGRAGAYNGQYFDGLIDDVKLFNYALTDSQVKLIYNQGAANYGPVTGAP